MWLIGQLIHWRVDGEVVEVVDRGLYALRLETLTRELRLLCVVNMALTAETTATTHRHTFSHPYPLLYTCRLTHTPHYARIHKYLTLNFVSFWCW